MHPMYASPNKDGDTVNWYMVLWRTQNLHKNGSSFSHITTEQCCNHFSVDIQSALCKATVTRLELHMTKVQWVCLEAQNSAVVAIVKHLGLIWR